ncbi:MAG: hypothetical protein ACRDJ9_24320 [Dehalococcoidia bacterium]
MRIEIFGARNAPQLEETRQLVDEAVAEAGATDAEVIVVAVDGPEDARAKKSFGTPTVRVDGLDVEYAEREPEEYSAGGRYSATPEGWKSQPARGLIVRAITAARARAQRS